MMPCRTASMGACSLPAAALDSCRSDGPVASLHHPRHLLGPWAWWGSAGPAHRELQPWQPSSHAHPSPLLPACLASCPRAPSPSPTSKLLSSCFITMGSPPALQHPSCCVPSGGGCPSSRSAVAMAPSIPFPTGQPHLSPPWAAQVSGRQAGTRGGLHIT